MGMKKYHLSDDECSSAYSDTIISVIESIISGRFEGRSSLKTYTYQIFMNKCVDVIRKKSTNKSMVFDTEEIDEYMYALPDRARTAVQQMVEKSNRAILAQKIDALGNKCKRLLLMFEDGFSDKEIAAEMQYNSVDVVKTSRLRCLDKLREKIGSLQWHE
jgi:RNA polymerase sigma factor (sigma-70 family)